MRHRSNLMVGANPGHKDFERSQTVSGGQAAHQAVRSATIRPERGSHRVLAEAYLTPSEGSKQFAG